MRISVGYPRTDNRLTRETANTVMYSKTVGLYFRKAKGTAAHSTMPMIPPQRLLIEMLTQMAIQGNSMTLIFVCLLRRAEEAMNGMLILNGTGPEPVFVGDPPRWEENPCGVGGYTWTLSRLEYMVTLCKAFLLTEDRRYLDKVESDLANWFETVPVPPIPHDYESACYYHAVHHWCMLEVGYRMVRTIPVLLSVLRAHGKNTALLERLRRSIAEHAERIAAGSLLLWPGRDHNHYKTVQDQKTFLFLVVPFLPGEVSGPEDISFHDGSLTFRFRDRNYHITEDLLGKGRLTL